MVFAILIALLVAAGAIPVKAGVYAIEQKDGSWRVSKYDDDDPTVRVTQFDRKKTIRLDKKVQKLDDSLKQYTLAGEARLAAYFNSDQEWLKQQSRNRLGRSEAKHFLAECVNDVCLPEPGSKGRPPYPSMEEGRDFTYGFKTVTVKVDAPNPDYLKYRQPWYIVSDRAKRPGGRWLIGTTEEMTNQEFNDYLLYLESATP